MTGQFNIDQKMLLSFLGTMQPICSKRTAIESTASILFQVNARELILKSSDLEISLQISCPITDSTIDESYSFLVPGKRIFDLVKELSGDIFCTVDQHQLLLKSGTAHVGLHIKSPDQFPPFPSMIENLTHFDAATLITLLNKVSFLIPQNNANQAFNGLLMHIGDQGLTLTSTDGHCLAQVKTGSYTLSQERQWLIPRRAISELKKIIEHGQGGNVFLGTCGNQLVFSGSSFNFFTKLLHDQFPAYQTILEKNGFVPARLDKEKFMGTLRRSSSLLSGNFLATKFSFTKDLLNVSLDNKEVGSLNESLPIVSFDGAPFDIRFYAPYLINGLQAFEDTQVSCYIHPGAKPIIFEAATDAYHLTYLVMPVSQTQG